VPAGTRRNSRLFSGTSATSASVVSIGAAMEAAFCSAERRWIDHPRLLQVLILASSRIGPLFGFSCPRIFSITLRQALLRLLAIGIRSRMIGQLRMDFESNR
jgi:hypothetical protein